MARTYSQTRPERSETPARRFRFDTLRSGEYWLNKIGIGLLLLGLIFLYKYSVDQGWLAPLVRVAFGLVLGTALLGIGLRVYRNHRHFSQVVLGGSIAAYYTTGFAAFNLYALVVYPVAFAFMVSVTVLAVLLALRHDEVVLSVIGVAGALATPFLLYAGAENVPALVVYICLVLAGIGAIYFYRGWRSLLLTAFVGAWIVFLVSASGISWVREPVQSDQWALQLGVVFGWLSFWALPVFREVLCATNPDRWSWPSLGIFEGLRPLAGRHAHILTVATPLIALGLSRLIWQWTDEGWGWITLALAAIYGITAWVLGNREATRGLARVHALTALLFLTLAFVQLLNGNALFLTLALEAAALHLLSRRLSERALLVGGHLLFALVGLWLVERLIVNSDVGVIGLQAIFNTSAITDLAVLGLALGTSTVLRPHEAAFVYRICVHAAFLGWLWRELSVLPDGDAFVTVAWGLYTVALLIAGLQLAGSRLVIVGMGTLLLVVAKLLLVDLISLDAVWRILLFLGFGGVFLILSYYLQALWRARSESPW
ncbi:MAG: DUF2339 domain-containing protein [Actinomycetota bacterium]|nr:DUF2339 domain-containing protein [Actinomycetota bacterium]